jgi:invasion protein IalB
MTATVVLRQNNERLARVILRRQPETRSLTMIFQLPHGAWLPGGVQWQVDEGEGQRLPFNTSDAEGLYAGIAVTDDVLGTLRRGTTLRLAVVAAAQRQVLNIPVALARMNEAFGEFVAQERAR